MSSQTVQKPPDEAATAPAKPASGKQKTQFPAPKFTLVRDTDRGKNCWKFFEYWQSLSRIPLNGSESETMASVAEVRVYRCWPVIDLKQNDPGRKNIVFDFLYGECPLVKPNGSPADPEEYIPWFINRYGAGDWKVMLVENGVPSDRSGVMTALFKARSLEGPGEDLDQFPPKLDFGTVKQCEENRSFVDWCKRNSKPLPWDVFNDEEEGFMAMSINPNGGGGGSAVGEALRTVVDSTVRLSEKAVDNAERLADAKIEAIQQSAKDNAPSAQAVATQESIRLVTGTAEAMIRMVTENSGKSYDPVEMLKATANIMHDQPKQSGGEGLDRIVAYMEKSNDRYLTMMAEQNKILQDVLTRQSEIQMRRTGPDSYEPEPPKSFAEQLAEFKGMADALGFSRGGAGGSTAVAPVEREAKQSWFNETTAPIIMMGLQTCLILVGNVVHNWAVVKFKTGEPQAPADAVANAQRMMQQQQTAAGEPQAAQANPAQAQEDAERAGWKAFIAEFTGPFIAHLFVDPPAEPNGYGLAHFLQSDGTMQAITQNGRRNYLAIRQKLGRQGFEALCRGHEPLWSKCGGHPGVRKFIDQFMTFDEWQQRVQADAAAKKTDPAPVVS